jgi:DNA-binding transcriptional MerR regulator
MREYYTITELTREFEISTRTLRFYEDEGLIQPVRRGRTRLFKPSDRHLIRQIMRGKRLGFSINEIREIIQMYKSPPGEVGQLKLMIKRIEEKREDCARSGAISKRRFPSSTTRRNPVSKGWPNLG